MRKTLCIVAALLAVLPAAAQETEQELPEKIKSFMEHDPFGISMAIIAMGVVFIALIILYLCFKWSGKLLNRKKNKPASKPARKEKVVATVGISPVPSDKGEAAEVAAAIGMALFLAEDGMHDTESDTLTLIPAEQAWTGHGANQKQDPARHW